MSGVNVRTDVDAPPDCEIDATSWDGATLWSTDGRRVAVLDPDGCLPAHQVRSLFVGLCAGGRLLEATLAALAELDIRRRDLACRAGAPEKIGEAVDLVARLDRIATAASPDAGSSA